VALKGKRLFWAAIIVVELAVIYALWRPRSSHLAHPARTTAAGARQPAPLPPSKEEASVAGEAAEPKQSAASSAPAPEAGTARAPVAKAPVAKAPAVGSVPAGAPRPPANQSATTAMLPSKPSAIPHVPSPVQRRAPAVSASLISRIPVPAAKSLAPPAPLSPLDSFWCQMSNVETNCNCRGGEERAANAPLR
jgi:hypothetical protein